MQALCVKEIVLSRPAGGPGVRLYNEPGPWGNAFFPRTMFLPLAIAVLTLHLLLAGVAAAGPIVAGVAQWRGVRRHDPQLQRAARSLAQASLLSLLAAIGLGFLLWFLYGLQAGLEFETRGARLGRLWTDDAGRFWGELGFTGVVLGIAIVFLQRQRGLRWLVPVLLLLAGTNLLYHLPLRFSIFNVLQSRGIELTDGLTRVVKHQLLGEPQLWSRLLHHWGAMFVAAGLAWQWIRSCANSPSAGDAPADPPRNGALLVLLGVAAQFFSGPWLLFQLPAARQNQYLGEQLAAMVCLGSGIAAALLALIPTFGLAFDTAAAGQVQQRRRWVATILLVMAWAGMIAGQLVQR